MLILSRPLLCLLVLILPLVHCQNRPVCNYIDNVCTQDSAIVSELQSRALPEFSEYVSCFVKFANEEECLESCFFEADVFSIGGETIGQCYPNITMLDLPQEEAADCFQVGTIWRKQLPCVGYDSGEECDSVQGCQWYGGICGPQNDTLTDRERENLFEAFQGLVELGTNGTNGTLINQIRQSIVTNPSYFCDEVIPELLLCSIEQKPLNSECGDVLSWYWESENDRQLFEELEKCSDPLKQSSAIVCEVFFQNLCQYNTDNQECESSGDVMEYLLNQVTIPSPSRSNMSNPVRCLLHGTNQDACVADGNCQFGSDVPNYFKQGQNGVCDGVGVEQGDRLRLVQATLQVGENCFSEDSDAQKLANCIQYPINRCPPGPCTPQEQESRCIPDDPNFPIDILDNVTALDEVLTSSLNTSVVNDGFINIDYCAGEFIDMMDCITTKRDFECAAEIVSAIFPNADDQRILNGTLKCDQYNGDSQQCEPNAPFPISIPVPTPEGEVPTPEGEAPQLVELKSVEQEPVPGEGDGENSALRSSFLSLFSLSLSVVLLTLFMM